MLGFLYIYIYIYIFGGGLKKSLRHRDYRVHNSKGWDSCFSIIFIQKKNPEDLWPYRRSLGKLLEASGPPFCSPWTMSVFVFVYFLTICWCRLGGPLRWTTIQGHAFIDIWAPSRGYHSRGLANAGSPGYLPR